MFQLSVFYCTAIRLNQELSGDKLAFFAAGGCTDGGSIGL